MTPSLSESESYSSWIDDNNSKTGFFFVLPLVYLARPIALPVTLPMVLVDVLSTAILGYTAGVVLSSMCTESTIAVAMAGLKLVTNDSPAFTGVVAGVWQQVMPVWQQVMPY